MGFLHLLLEHWAQADALEDPRLRSDARRAVLGIWANNHPQEVKAYIDTLETPAARSGAAREVGPALMGSVEPAEAATWWLRHSTSDERSTALNEISLRWTEIDLVAAAGWLQQQENGPEVDTAKHAFAMHVSQRVPEAATEWANSIADEKLRLDAVSTLRTPDLVEMRWP